jgi:hypothetical protein
MLFPVSVGRGLRVFPDDQIKSSWSLSDQISFPNGVLALNFHLVK